MWRFVHAASVQVSKLASWWLVRQGYAVVAPSTLTASSDGWLPTASLLLLPPPESSLELGIRISSAHWVISTHNRPFPMKWAGRMASPRPRGPRPRGTPLPPRRP